MKLPKILYLCAEADDGGADDYQEEYLAIAEAVWVDDQPVFAVVPKYGLKATELQDLLREHQPVIVHFAGHGATDPDAQETDTVAGGLSPELLTRLLKLRQDSIRGVILNACYSEEHARRIIEFIDYAVGTTGDILDSDAPTFVGEFYRELAYGGSVADAVAAGQRQIEVTQGESAGRIQLECKSGVEAANVRFMGRRRRPIRTFLDDEVRATLKRIPEECLPLVREAFGQAAPGVDPPSMRSRTGRVLEYAERLASLMPYRRNVDGSQEEALPPLFVFLKLLTIVCDCHDPLPVLLSERLARWLKAVGISQLADGGTAKTWRDRLDQVGWSLPETRLQFRVFFDQEGDCYCEVYYGDVFLGVSQRLLRDESALRGYEPALRGYVAEQMAEAMATQWTDTADTASGERLWIEFFLPRDMLDYAVEQWDYAPLDPEGLARSRKRIGTVGRVVVRDDKRNRNEKYDIRRAATWKRFDQVSAAHPFKLHSYAPDKALCGDAVYFAGPAGDGEALEECLLDSDAVCALLADGRTDHEVRFRVLRACIPVALWIRGPRPELQVELQDFMQQGPLRSLPRRVREIRVRGRCELSKHLTLLWDDPNNPFGALSYRGTEQVRRSEP